MKNISRRNFLKHTGQTIATLALSGSIPVQASPRFDLVLKGGTILDGTGAAGWQSDIGITGDQISAIGEISTEQAKRVMDVAGLYVSPGFIDIHSHSDYSLLIYPSADSRVRQGITTEITGNCGSSAAPIAESTRDAARKDWDQDHIDANWTDIASFFSTLEKKTFAVNQALLVGQGTLRENIVGYDNRNATADERKALLRAVEVAMEQGAVGLSTGLEYTPGIFTPTEEIVDMARVVARYGGFYSSHTRNEEARVLEAISEAIDIGRHAGTRVQISHLKTCGRVNWRYQEPSLDLIEAGRKEGIDVMADAYPYTAYSTGLTVHLQPWVRDGGTQAMLQRLKDPQMRERIRKELDDRILNNEPGGYDLIVISSVDKNKQFTGKNILQIAEVWKVEPVEAFIRLIEEEGGSVSHVGHGMSPENVELVLAHPVVMIGSDGYSLAPVGRSLESQPHPRSYGTYSRLLAYYVRERKTLDLPTAIKKMTSMPADQVGLNDRGRIAVGKKADLVAFRLEAIKDKATFEKPQQFPDGIAHVLINGVPVVTNASHTGARPGRILRKA